MPVTFQRPEEAGTDGFSPIAASRNQKRKNLAEEWRQRNKRGQEGMRVEAWNSAVAISGSSGFNPLHLFSSPIPLPPFLCQPSSPIILPFVILP